MQKINSPITALILITTLATWLGAVSLSCAQERMIITCDIWPPYQMHTENDLNGFSTEIIRNVFAQLGQQEPIIQPLPWKRALDLILKGDADAIFSINRTPNRELFLRYPQEHLFQSPWVIWIKGNKHFPNLNALRGKKVGVVLGYSYTPEFWDFIRANSTVEQVHSDSINFKKLSLDRLDAAIAEYGNGLFHVRAIGDSSVHPVPGIVIKEDGLYLAFSRSRVDQEFVDRFSQELAAFKKTPEYQRLVEKYLSLEQ